MALIHNVIDSDVRFAIDPVTRNISNQGSSKLVLTRGDHNSERFTFEIPRYVEGHDMSLCNVVRIHFINTNSKTREEMADVYEPDDASLLPTNDQLFTFSWLIDRKATTFAGPLAFAIEFQCIVDGLVVYSWRTAANSTITIVEGIDNTDSVEVVDNEPPVDIYSTIRAATVAATIHDIIDSDVRFIIDPVKRAISNNGSGKLILIRGDHNSERFTFEIPRLVEGHDMSLCNVVRIHYINTESRTRATREDIYEPNDLRVSAENTELVHFSWLLSNNATFYTGSLAFSIEFQCVVDDVVEYAWHTGINNTIAIAESIDNAEIVGENISDILASWWHRLYSDSTLPIEIHTMESFEALNGDTEPDTLYLLEDDPTIEELIRLQDPLRVLEVILKDVSTIKNKVNEIGLHSDAIVTIQNNMTKLSAQVGSVAAAVDGLVDKVEALEDRIDALEDNCEPDPDIPDTPIDPDDPDDPEHTHEYNEMVEVVDATCNTHGYTVYKCSCGLTENRNYTDPLDHLYNHTVIDPTCTEQGYTTHVCTRCGHTYKDTYTPAVGHTWEYYQDPGAGETGWSRRCTVCGIVETDVEYGCKFGGEHAWVADGAINATCTTPGYQKYKCSACGETKQEANAAPLSPTREHSWSDAIYDVEGCFPPTCYEHGHAAYVCKRCGVEKQENVPVLKHQTTDIITPPTCTEQGYTTRKCTRNGCDYSYVLNDSYVAATGHTWGDPIEFGNGYARECTKCGTIMNITQANCDHASEEVLDVVAATCTTGGFTKYLCTMCNREETRDHVAALGHKYVSQVTEPTCDAQGYTTHTCSRCGDSYVDSYVKAGAHSWSGWTIIEEAKCEEDGLRRRTCSACGKVEEENVEALTHSTVYIPGKEPTCTESGHTGYNECTLCGKQFGRNYLEPYGHTLTTTPEVPATCTEEGRTARTSCSRCGYYTGGDATDPLDHSYTTEVVPPTCTEGGYTVQKCTRPGCNHSFIVSGSQTPATGHTWDDPVDTGTGYVYSCVHCGATKNVTEDNCSHYDEVIDSVNATCESGGYTVYKCSMCNREETREHTPALGHDYKSVVTSPTCTSEGYTTHTCSRCGDSYVDSRKSMIAHSWTEWVTLVYPTCEDDGERRRTCSVCDKVDVEKLEATSHDLTTVPEIPPTCTEPGRYALTTCSKCDYSSGGGYIEPNGHDYTSEEVPATCTDGGYTVHTCTVCGDWYTDDETEPNGHNFFHGWFEIKAPTCTETGIEKRECLECGHSEERDIPALEHDWEYYPDPAVSSGTSRRCRVCETVEEDATA